MKKLYLVLMIVVGGVAAGCSGGNDGEVFPKDSKNKVVFVNYWAKWCEPCRREIPALNRFAKEYRDQVVVYAVNFDGVTGEALRQQVQALGIEFFVMSTDPGPVLGWAPPEALPQTVIMDPEGQRTQVLLGEQDSASLKQALDAFLRGDQPSDSEQPQAM